MTYKIHIAAEAENTLLSLPRKIQRQISEKIDMLAQNPRPPGVKKLKGLADLYRISSGDYRIVFRIHHKKLLVLVVRIGHRSDIYQNLP
jgi:mRNA interferase RelE/StbE